MIIRYLVLSFLLIVTGSVRAEEMPGGNKLAGLSVWTIFDSLGGGEWQEYFSSITGSLFYPEVNRSFISAGGTNTSVNNRYRQNV